MNAQQENPVWPFIEGYVQNVLDGFESRWSKVDLKIYEKHVHEATGGLLSRQAVLAIELAKVPSMWNGHTAPLILRCMTDAYITFAWILDDLNARSERYIHYGLGQEKLFIEYLEGGLAEDPDSYDAGAMQEMIEVRKAWLNRQLAEWGTEVNVGSWSGLSTREMAKAIGRESIYRFAYVPFSGPVHNMWQHVGRYNMEPCTNPMHKWHLVPKVRRAPIDPDFMYRAARYVSLAYELSDEKLSTTSEVPLPVNYFIKHEPFSRT